MEKSIVTLNVKTVLTGVYVIAFTAMLTGCVTGEPERTYFVNESSYTAEGWAPGHWVLYEYTPPGGKPVPVTITVTGKVPDYNEDYFRIELLYGKKNNRRATCVVTPELEPDDFFQAEGDLLPGSKGIWRLNGGQKPNKVLGRKAADPTGTSFQDVFDGGPDTNLVGAGPLVEYETLSGKKLSCREYTIIRESEIGTALLSEEVSVTGIAEVKRASSILKVVDFGKSGAGSAFDRS